jgi:hypothetical protein
MRSSRLFNALFLVGIIALLVGTVAVSAAPQKSGIDAATSYAPLLKAIRLVESNDNPTPPGYNDGGDALGAYQIHYDYWLDARVSRSDKYENVKDTTYATRCVVHYWRRYCPDAIDNADFDRLVLTHHCGPSATTGSKERDAEYIQKVKTALRMVLDHGERRRLTATPDT